MAPRKTSAWAGSPTLHAAFTNDDVAILTGAELELAVSAARTRIAAVRDSYETQVRQLKEEWNAQVTDLAARLATALSEGEAAEERLKLLEERVESMSVVVDPRPAAPDQPRPAQAGGAAPQRSAPKRSKAGPSRPDKEPLSEWLARRGIEVIDKRDRPNGSLWITGSRATVSPVIEALRARGVVFTYAAAGSRATGGRPGWFTKYAG